MRADIKAGGAYVELMLKDKRFRDGLQASSAKFSSFAGAMRRVGVAMGGASALFAAPFIGAVKAAANAQEGLAKFRSVFADQAAAADQFAKTLSSSIGRSVHDIRAALATFQSFNVGLGFGADQARGMSEQMQKLALDFAAFHNIEDQDAIGRFIAAMSGSSEVLDQFGVNIKQAAIEQELLAMGINKTAQDASEQEKVLARLNIIMKAMGQQGAIGAAAREAGSFANQLKLLQASALDAAVQVGTALLPTVVDLMNKVNELMKPLAAWLAAHDEMIKQAALVVAGVASVSAGALALSTVFGGL